MRLAISNIAWDVAEDEQIAALLSQHSVDAIDIAPAKYFPDLTTTSRTETHAVKSWWAERGVEITGMQALLFGTSGLNMFGTVDVRDAMLARLAEVCRIGEELGATRLVFGSPRSRDRLTLADDDTQAIAIDFFGRLGDIAERHGVVVCLEPNPPRYGANFMTTSAETAATVSSVGHSAIRMQLDTGAMQINGESPETVVSSFGHLIGHIHASEPDLKPLGDCGTDHAAMHAILATSLPYHVVSIEMLATESEPHLSSVERALASAIACYRPESRNYL